MKTSTKIERPRDDTATHRQTTPPIPGFSPRSEDAIAQRLRTIAPQRVVLVAGLVSTLIYLAFVAVFPITTWWDHPHTNDLAADINDMGRITGYSPVAAVGFVSAILALFVCQFLAMTAADRVQHEVVEPRVERFVRRALFGFPLLFGAIMVWMQPVLTTDLYGYVARGYLFARLHLNPMTTAASLLPGGLTVNRPASPYGPAWLLVAGALSAISGDNLLLNMLAFKLIGLGAVAVAIWLVDRLARRLCPERRLRVIALFAWSPLLIVESVGNGHNDIVMVALVLAALMLMLRDRPRWALVCLVLGALVKYESAIFIPLWLVYEVRRRLALPTAADDIPIAAPPHVRVYRRVRSALAAARQADLRRVAPLVASGGALALALVVACYMPFWDGLNTFTGLGQQLRPLYYNSSLVGFISGPLQLIVPSQHDAALDKTLRLTFYTLFFVYAYIQTARLWRAGQRITLDDVVSAAAKITFAALLLITFWFQPWYVVWLLPLAALSREPFIRRQGTIFAAGALLSYAVGNFLFVNDPSQDIFVQFFEILVVFGPLLLLRAAPYEQGYAGILRRYVGAFGEGLRLRPVFWERVMLVLIVVVGALLRIVQLGNIYATLPTTTTEGSLLNQISGDLRLGLVDPQGLAGPFYAVEALLVRVFGRTPLAYLLPSAVIGSVTVIAIYLLAYEIMRLGNFPGRRTVAILAALLAATSRWHVSLSRSGVELVLLPLLMCLAVFWLLRALHAPSPAPASAPASEPVPAPLPLPSALDGAPLTASSEPVVSAAETPPQVRRRQWLSYAACGICTGLACDVAPGLWLVPLIVLGFLAIWQWRRPKGHGVTRSGLVVLSASALVTGLPVIWHYLSRVIGFPVGSGLFARTSVQQIVGPGPLTLAFWGQVGHNALDVLSLLATQDYSAGFPANGGAPIIPALLGPAFYLGLLLVLWRWRRFESLALLLLVALPLAAAIAVGTPTGTIEAASILPAMCILPAFALYEVGMWLSHLPIVFDRVNGVRVFASPEQIGRLLLLLFLVVSTIRTFFWYFEASLPAHQPQYTPSFVAPSRIVQMASATDAATSAGSEIAGAHTVWVAPSVSGVWHVTI